MNCVSCGIQVRKAGHLAKPVWGTVFSIPLLGIRNVPRILGDPEESLLKSPPFFKLDSLPPKLIWPLPAFPSRAVCSTEHLWGLGLDVDAVQGWEGKVQVSHLHRWPP